MTTPVRVGVVGLGKMGLSHQAILDANEDVEVAGVCDSSGYVLGVLSKYTGVKTFTDLNAMLDATSPDALVIATPSALHAPMARAALDRGIHIFCEKPFCLTSAEGSEIAEEAESRGLVTQVGYHNRFVGSFGEVKRLLDLGAIGTVTHVLAEAYGPVVLRAQAGTWRSKAGQGGGALYDYAAHPLNLVNWYLGEPHGVGGTELNSVFSRETDDEVFSTLYFDHGTTAQLSVSWSDESVRKMTTRITIWGTAGRIFADRQECQVFLRSDADIPHGYEEGWNTRYTTDLTAPVSYYLRGEEYTAQMDHFVERVATNQTKGTNDFASAVVTDRVIELMARDAALGPRTVGDLAAMREAPDLRSIRNAAYRAHRDALSRAWADRRIDLRAQANDLRRRLRDHGVAR